MTSNARQLAQIPSTPSGRKNVIYNGDMLVAQRSTSVNRIKQQQMLFTVDDFIQKLVARHLLTIARVTDSPDGFANLSKIYN